MRVTREFGNTTAQFLYARSTRHGWIYYWLFPSGTVMGTVEK